MKTGAYLELTYFHISVDLGHFGGFHLDLCIFLVMLDFMGFMMDLEL